MPTGCAGAAVLSLGEHDRIEAADRIEYAMRIEYPGGTHDPALWAALVPEVRPQRFSGVRMSAHGVRLMAARLRGLPAGPLGPECRLWAALLPLLLPEEYYPLVAAVPTVHAPGSPEKILELRARAETKRELFHRRDCARVLPLPEQGKPRPAKNFEKAGGGGGKSSARHGIDRAREAEGRTRALRGLAGGKP
jgi:hypothetical protein